MIRLLKLLSITVCIGMLACGCKTTTRQQVEFKTLKATSLAVDSALKAYYECVVNGKVSEDTQINVRAMRAKYQQSMNAALTLARFDTSAHTSTDVADAASSLIVYINNLIKAFKEVPIQ